MCIGVSMRVFRCEYCYLCCEEEWRKEVAVAISQCNVLSNKTREKKREFNKHKHSSQIDWANKRGEKIVQRAKNMYKNGTEKCHQLKIKWANKQKHTRKQSDQVKTKPKEEGKKTTHTQNQMIVFGKLNVSPQRMECIKLHTNILICTNTYKRKSCSQYGSFPFTVTVVDFTFCSFNVTYVLNCVAGISIFIVGFDWFHWLLLMVDGGGGSSRGWWLLTIGQVRLEM